MRWFQVQGLTEVHNTHEEINNEQIKVRTFPGKGHIMLMMTPGHQSIFGGTQDFQKNNRHEAKCSIVSHLSWSLNGENKLSFVWRKKRA